jgi:hypothetical protein
MIAIADIHEEGDAEKDGKDDADEYQVCTEQYPRDEDAGRSHKTHKENHVDHTSAYIKSLIENIIIDEFLDSGNHSITWFNLGVSPSPAQT